jgi:cytochrome c-type biogenesis protein CcmH/NrfG
LAVLSAVVLAAVAAWIPAGEPEAGALRDVMRTAAASGPDTRALRATKAEAALIDAIRRRPGDARSWLAVAWARMVRGRPHVAEIAAHARRLDPSSRAVAREAERLGAAP